MKSFCKLHPEFCTLGVKTGYRCGQNYSAFILPATLIADSIHQTMLLHLQICPSYLRSAAIRIAGLHLRRELFSGLLLGHFVSPTYSKDNNQHIVQNITSLPSQKLSFMLKFKNKQMDKDYSKNTGRKIFSMPNRFILSQIMTRGQP